MSESDMEFVERVALVFDHEGYVADIDWPILFALARRGDAMQWRPIEEAPKDGTQFLVWDAYYGVRIGRCFVRPDHDDWLSYMDAFKGSSKGGQRATHWMPLPPPPKGAEE